MQTPDANDPKSAAPQNSAQPVLKAEVMADAPKVSATPVSNALQPDKNVAVPKYGVCMASDPTVDETAINAVITKRAK
jgi:hypothetical protein